MSDDTISRAFVLSGLDALRPVKPKGEESPMEAVNRIAWDCALNCAEAVARTAPPTPDIVRCRDCKWYDITHPYGTVIPDAYHCKANDRFYEGSHFCAYGERRDDVRNP